MKIINKTDTTLIFSDINLVLTYDPEGNGVEIEDLDLKSSSALMGYIDKGKVEVADKDKNNLMYKRIENRKVLIEKKEARTIKRVGEDEAESSENENKKETILGGESKIFSSKNKVNVVSKDSAIDKFRQTGEMDLAYFGPCFDESTIILTSDGVKRICDVVVGDFVLTHLGNWKRVTEVFKSKYEADIVNLNVGLQNNISLKCTPNHPLALYGGGWKAASNITEENNLLIPKIEFEKPDKYFSIYKEIDIVDNDFCSVTILDRNFGKILFHYLFNGKDENGYPVFLGSHSEIFEISEIAKNLHCCDQDLVIDGLASKCVVKSIDLMNLLHVMCGKDAKFIPKVFFKYGMSEEFLRMLFGSRNKNANGSVTIYTRHELVAWGVRVILLSSGIFSAIQYIPLKKSYCITAIIKPSSDLVKKEIVSKDLVSDSNRKPKNYFINDGSVSVYYSDCKVGEQVKYVYNLEVEDDHSYTANMIAAHNCHDAGGYAKMNRKYILGLAKKPDVNIYLKNASSKRDIEEEIIEQLDECEERTVGSDCPMIHGCTAPTFRWGGRKILYTMMETEKVHPQYIEKCNMANEVWLPSQWCVDKFRESGLVAKTEKIPIGVDFDLYKEGKESLDFGGKVKGFTFISVFGWSLRKCYDIMLRAFVEEFSSLDDVTYLVCSRYAGGTEEIRKDVCRNEIRNISTTIRKSGRPNIVYFGDVMPERLMGNLYNTAHCYLGLSRGEGFGLPWMEGSMCGLPVIGSNYSALTDFLNEDNSFLVEPECVRPQKGIEWISYYYQGMPVADYGREAINQTRRHMRYVYENYGKAKEKNKKLQKFIRENYDWEMCIEKMYNRVKDMYPKLKHRGEK